jgi:hypothetical protein
MESVLKPESAHDIHDRKSGFKTSRIFNYRRRCKFLKYL